MNLKKGNKNYLIKEFKNHWTVTTTEGGLEISVKVDKALCEDVTKLAEYIQSNEIF